MIKGSQRNRTSRAGKNRGAFSHPPPIDPQLRQEMRLRFTCTTAAVAKVITWQNLLDTIIVATSAITAVDLFDTVKIKKVEVWAVPVQGNAPQAVRVQFGGVQGSPSGSGRVFSDTSMGVTPAHVLAVPEKLSTDAMWQLSNAYTAFLLTCPVAAVIDVVVSFRTIQNVAVVAAAVPAAATVGEMYFRGLDGLAAAGTTLPADAPLTA